MRLLWSKCRTRNFALLNLIQLASAHWPGLFRSPCRTFLPFSRSTLPPKLMLSAGLLRVHLIPLPRSSIQILNSHFVIAMPQMTSNHHITHRSCSWATGPGGCLPLCSTDAFYVVLPAVSLPALVVGEASPNFTVLYIWNTDTSCPSRSFECSVSRFVLQSGYIIPYFLSEVWGQRSQNAAFGFPVMWFPMTEWMKVI